MDEDYARELDAGRDPKMQDAGRDQDMQMEALMRQMMQMTQDARRDQATQTDAQMMQMKDKVDGET